MKIAGLEKMTLVDYPGEVACTIFLYGCNFLCGFCHNPKLVVRKFGKGFSEEEVLRFLKKRRGKLDAICISGGEPLMSLDLDFVKKIKDLGYKVKVDTNGSFPEKLKEMIDLGLVDYVAMDVKASKKNYFKVAGVEADVGNIEKSMGLISGLKNYEFRTTVVEKFHNVSEMKAIGRWLNDVCGKRPKKFFLQGFKSRDNLIDNSFSNEKDVSEKYLDELTESISEFFKEVGVRI